MGHLFNLFLTLLGGLLVLSLMRGTGQAEAGLPEATDAGADAVPEAPATVCLCMAEPELSPEHESKPPPGFTEPELRGAVIARVLEDRDLPEDVRRRLG